MLKVHICKLCPYTGHNGRYRLYHDKNDNMDTVARTLKEMDNPIETLNFKSRLRDIGS